MKKKTIYNYNIVMGLLMLNIIAFATCTMLMDIVNNEAHTLWMAGTFLSILIAPILMFIIDLQFEKTI